MSNALHKALGTMSGKKTGTASKAQRKSESLGFLKKLADKEVKTDASYHKKFGTYEDRIKKIAATRKY